MRAGKVEFGLAGAMGAAIVATRQSGPLGNKNSTDTTLTGLVAFDVFYTITPHLAAGVEMALDWYSVPQVNIVLGDGGDSRALTFSLGVRYSP